MLFGGYKVIATEYCSNLVQARKHKKKRINKKWLKRYGMKRVPMKNLLVIDGFIIGHPSVVDKLIEEVRNREKAEKRSTNLSGAS